MPKQDEAIWGFLLKLGHAVEAEAKNIAPVREGRLKNDIQVFDDNLSSFEVAIGNSALIHYAPFVHFGTKPHVIKPKEKKALKTPYGIFRSVQHPGSKANPYLENALQNITSSPKLDYLMEELGGKIHEDVFETIKKSLKTITIG